MVAQRRGGGGGGGEMENFSNINNKVVTINRYSRVVFSRVFQSWKKHPSFQKKLP